MNTFFRVYGNLDRSATIEGTDEDMKELEAYNRAFRPGCAQFVNGKCVYRGYLSVEQAKTIDPTVTETIDGVDVKGAVEAMATLPQLIKRTPPAEEIAFETKMKQRYGALWEQMKKEGSL